MSGETEKDVSGWTVDTSREHVLALLRESEKRLDAEIKAADLRNDQRFTREQQAVKDALIAQKEAVAAALAAAEKAVAVAENNAEKWRANANEWRGSMTDRENKFAEVKAVDAKFRSHEDKLASIEARMNRNDGRSGGLNSSWGYLIGAAGLLATLLAIFFALRK